MRDFDFLIPLDYIDIYTVCECMCVCACAYVCVSVCVWECGDPMEDSIRGEELRFISGTQVQNQSGD